MIFQHTWQAVLEGRKTQTRRLGKPNEYYVQALDSVCLQNGDGGHYGDRLKWQVGRTYAVQPGWGQKQAGRIRITAIRQEDVRRIIFADSQAEGFLCPEDFLENWVSMHDKSIAEKLQERLYYGAVRCETSDIDLTDYWALLDSRPAHRYLAWVLEFELVQAAEVIA